VFQLNYHSIARSVCPDKPRFAPTLCLVNMNMAPIWLPQAALISASIGVLSHYFFWIRFEFDRFFYKIALAVLILQPLTLLALQISGLGMLQSIVILSVLEGCYCVALFSSITLYRLFFHPLHKFPGPFWARLWMWWKISKFAEEGKGYMVVHELHRKYGDVVRIGRAQLLNLALTNELFTFSIGPRQLSINHVDAIDAIYGSKTTCSKSVMYSLGKLQGIPAIRDPEKHHFHRTIWDRGLNGKGRIDPHTNQPRDPTDSLDSMPAVRPPNEPD
jgi:hypothetical protein